MEYNSTKFIRVTLQEWQPFVFKPRRSGEPVRGVFMIFLEDFVRRMNLGLSRLDVFHEEGRKMENGSWTGQMKDIMANKTDIALGPMLLTYDKAQDADYTHYIFMDQLRLLSSVKSADPDMLILFLDNVDWQVWLTLFLSFAVLNACYSLIDFTEREVIHNVTYQKISGFGQYFFNFLSAYLSKGFRITPKTPILKSITGLTLMLVLFLSILMTSVIHTNLVVRPSEKMVDTLEDFYKLPKLCPLIIDNTQQMELIKDSTEPAYKDMYKRISRCPDSTCIYWKYCSTPTGFKNVARNGYVFVDSIVTFISFGNDICEHWPQTWLHISKPFSARIALAIVRKGFDQRIKEALNRHIEKIVESGLFEFWLKELNQRPSECFLREFMEDDEDNHSQLEVLRSLFVFYCLGCLLSFLSLGIEMLYKEIGF